MFPGLFGQHFLGNRPDVLHKHAVEARHQKDEQHENVEVGRAGECGTALLHTAQVDHGHDQHAEQTDRNRPLLIQTGRRTYRKHTTGNTHRDRQDVVNQQRCTGNKRWQFAEVLATHDVCPAPRRVRVNRLAIAQYNDDHQHTNNDRDRDQFREGDRTDARLQQQHNQNFVSGVGR